MKSVFLMFSGIFALTIAFTVGAKGVSVPAAETTDTNQPACHIQEQRKSEFCQKIMFPPIPFR